VLGFSGTRPCWVNEAWPCVANFLAIVSRPSTIFALNIPLHVLRELRSDHTGQPSLKRRYPQRWLAALIVGVVLDLARRALSGVREANDPQVEARLGAVVGG
jgi:hypothetical protein